MDDDGKPLIIQYKSNDFMADVVRLTKLLAEIDRNCEIVSCPDLASIDPKDRENLISCVGVYGAESVVLANKPNRLLWADDGILGGIAQGIHKVRRVWTQVVLASAVESSIHTANDFNIDSARLLRFGYAFTWWTIDIFEAGASIAKWNPHDPQFKCFLDSLGLKSVDFPNRASHAAGAIRSIYRAGIAPRVRNRLVVLIMDRLAQTEEIQECAGALIGVLRTLDLKEPEFVRDAIAVIRVWYRYELGMQYIPRMTWNELIIANATGIDRH